MMDFLKSMDASTWAAVLGGLAAVVVILLVKFLRGFSKGVLIAAVIAAAACMLYNAGVFQLP
jgi:hypothetical protein